MNIPYKLRKLYHGNAETIGHIECFDIRRRHIYYTIQFVVFRDIANNGLFLHSFSEIGTLPDGSHYMLCY